MPTNVLFLHAGDDWIRGSETALLTLLAGVDRKRIRPFLLTSNARLASAAQELEVQTAVQPLPEIMIDWPQLKLQFGTWTRILIELSAFIKRHDIKLVYCNGGSTCQVGYYAAKLHGIPVICHVHSLYDRRYVRLYRMHLASHVIFVSQAVERSICIRNKFRSSSEVVHNGVDISRFEPSQQVDRHWKERLSLPRDAVIFGQISSLISRKGIDILLKAFVLVIRRHADAYLVLVGDGSQRDEYVAAAKELGIAANVVWAGHQPDPLPYYQHVFDINVLASRNDAFPLTLLEAGACGLPNLAANVDGIPEAVIDGGTGLLFDREDVQMLADKMSLLVREPGLRRKLGAAARQSIVDRFSVKKFCTSIQNTILKQVGGQPIAIEGES